jgi:DNA polymerase III delta prime subunit
MQNASKNEMMTNEPPVNSATTAMPWVEKYRPTQFDNIILDPLNRVFFQNIIQKGHFPNLLFYGPPGTGKTTTIINLINSYQTMHTRKNKETVIHLNASDERGVDIIRTQIYQFVMSHHIFETGCKFVILDEVDYMTKNAQQALKTLLQTSHQNVRFCLICNYISKIDKSLQREFICVRFNQLPKPEIKQFVQKIATAEQIRIDDDEVELLMSSYQSDIRSMINFMQSACFPKIGETTTDTQHKFVKNAISMLEWNHLHTLFVSAKYSGREARGVRGLTREDFKDLRSLEDVVNPKFINRSAGESLKETRMKIIHKCASSVNGRRTAEYINDLSITHNIHKKQILLGYMSLVLRNHLHLVTQPLLSIFEQTSHSSDDMNIDDVVNYFAINVADAYRG